MSLSDELSATSRASAFPSSSEPGWWKSAVVYQVYPRSFQDSDGDGLGDLRGIMNRLDHLERLGVDVIWLSPIYRSPQADNGYDISDYEAIDPVFGTMDDFDDLLARAHERGMKIVMDLVVNHTSDEHPWFVESRSSPDNPRRDWYWWRDARPGTTPGEAGSEPNNWGSFFSGSTWEFDPQSGQYYLHLFDRKQPDLNWENPDVRHAVYAMMRRWLDRGVDGFRMDVINLISKHPGLPDGEMAPGSLYGDGFPLFAHGPRLHEFLQEMHREVFEGRSGLLTVGEMPGVTPDEAMLFTDPARRELDMVFQFEHVGLDHGDGSKFTPRPLAPGALAESLTRWQDALAESGWNSLYLSNHDQPRAVSRFGDDKQWWRESATALATILHLQRGTPYIYQGEELGMTNHPFASIDEVRDVESINHYFEQTSAGGIDSDVLAAIGRIGRDNARTPLQWDSSRNGGFTTGRPWIAVNPNTTTINAEDQYGVPGSVFEHYRALVGLRHERPVVADGSFRRIDGGSDFVFAFERKLGSAVLLVVANLSSSERLVELDAYDEPWHEAELVLGNRPRTGREAGLFSPWEARVYAL
ncbi:alpha-glucosidase [Herbiconiux sp.]|uniref:alpha-glucosidase n=1 Tax=Herbiconiux sp. TaxID=1871186 RepID=UPI0025B7B0BA|nr:alpha-glucosidase [Herbiconiux sp.]